MPYTQQQLQAASTKFRNVFSGHMPDAVAIRISLDNLAEMEAVNRDLHDELTGELIVGEPFTVYEGYRSRIVPYRAWNGRMGCKWERYETGPHHFADECNAAAAGWLECDRCGEWFHPDHADEAEKVDGDWYCSEDCIVDSGYRRCEHCDEWYNEDWGTSFELRGEYHDYCSDGCAENDGYVRCEHCDGWEHESWAAEVNTDGRTETWCDSCASDDSATCYSCGERHHIDDMRQDGYEWYCQDCARGSELLHEYGYAPSLNFLGEGGPYMGVELETDGGYDRDMYCRDLSGLDGFDECFWMTEDGSLENGVEITSHPMTLSYHLRMYYLYEGIGETAREYGYGSHNGGRCGLHIHVNRLWFGKSEVVQDAHGYKLMRLLQRFEQPLTRFSRRNDNHWCCYRTANDYTPKDDTPKILRGYGDQEPPLFEKSRLMQREQAHAQALNFEHRNTFEFRIFRGTLKWSTYFACLALVYGLCHAVKRHGSTWVESVTWYDLVAEVVELVDEPQAREHLVNYLNEKGLM